MDIVLNDEELKLIEAVASGFTEQITSLPDILSEDEIANDDIQFHNETNSKAKT